MASIEGVDIKEEVSSACPEKQSEIQLLQNADIENPDLENEAHEPPVFKNKRGSFLTCYLPIPKPLRYLIVCLLFVCSIPVVTVAILPLLLGAFVVTRLVQFFVKDVDIEKHFKFTSVLRYWVFTVVVLLLVQVGIFYMIAKYVPGLKLVMIIGLPITKWLKIICTIIGIYLISQVIWFVFSSTLIQPEDNREMSIIILESISEIIGCLLFWWAEVVVMSSVPTFKQSKIFGIYTRKWIEVSLFLLIGYNIITFLAHLFVWSLPKFLPKFYNDLPENGFRKVELSCICCYGQEHESLSRKYVVYAVNGTKRSIIFILSMVMLLITWVVYFGNHLGTTPEDKRVLEFGTWTFVSLLICSFLWLIKSCILLYWESRSVYERLHTKITDLGKQFYFLFMLSLADYWSAVVRSRPDSTYTDCGLSCTERSPEPWIPLDRKSLRADLINHIGRKASIHELQKAAELFLTAHYALSNEGIVADLDHLLGNKSEENNVEFSETLMETVEFTSEAYFEEDWEMLLKLLPDVKTTKDITFEKVKKFMERARSSCMFLSNTFISENEVVKCLNQVMRWIIIVAIFIMWLLLTGLASTKVLVIIASPALAATFIFGDTAKGLFQGLVFVYVVHPFDVGDLCVIDGQLMEVVRIGVWSTTFSNVRTIGEQQAVIYPNSMLSQKNVINYKANFDWTDRIEFLCPPDKKIALPLKQRIQNYLDHEKEKFVPNSHSVELVEMGDKAKIVVHIKHHLPGIKGWTNSECLKLKDERRFELAIELQNLLKELESETEAPVTAESARMEEFPTQG